jgi:hypothetical protein
MYLLLNYLLLRACCKHVQFVGRKVAQRKTLSVIFFSLTAVLHHMMTLLIAIPKMYD